MAKRPYIPLAGHGQRGVSVQLRPLEIAALAQIGGKHYTRLGDLIRDLLRMALAPRVAAMALAQRTQRDMATQRFDEKLQRKTAERTARRADPHTEADRRLVSDEPLAAMVTSVPVSDRAAFGRLAMRRGTTVTALLRQMVREAVAQL